MLGAKADTKTEPEMHERTSENTMETGAKMAVDLAASADDASADEFDASSKRLAPVRSQSEARQAVAPCRLRSVLARWRTKATCRTATCS